MPPQGPPETFLMSQSLSLIMLQNICVFAQVGYLGSRFYKNLTKSREKVSKLVFGDAIG